MNESTCKSTLVKKARARWPHAVIFRIEDRMTHGIPDIAITMNRKTSWGEAKYANPDFASPGIQELTLKRLVKSGYAYYVVFEDVPTGKRTYIVHPDRLDDWRNAPLQWSGFAYDHVLDYIEELHK